ncbi:MAG: hypothetical protein A2008_05225 [Candidatus Wallbacteria bacterium GWC2_49_35]|uniref:histidine kinase n=1 Tax=Candidatus Wallbacteria bacterium GWC2_49_35 TaxID=1817813 RepID=A0A1F7WUJ5_9BACT|nr:MAG: hypothetical protein A2008_05225 [Candidatus Wallbacteria bacterium GWC2_49_35]
MIKDKHYRKIIFFFSALIIIIITGGLYFSKIAGEKTAASLKAILLNRTKILSSLVNSNEIKKLKGSPEDVSSEVYLDYKRMFLNGCNSQTDIRYIYMMGYRDAKIFFYADSEPDAKADPSKPLAAPGEIYQEPPDGLKEVFLNGNREYTAGPYTDRWGTFFSAMLPVFDLDGKSVVCVVGMDMDARDWQYQVFKSRSLVWCLALSLVLAVFLFILNLKNLMRKNAGMQAKVFYQQAALKLAQFDNSDYKNTLERIVKCVADSTGTHKVSVWRFNEDCSVMSCETLYNALESLYESGKTLAAHDYPKYFKALNGSRNIAADDARTDERTREFLTVYLIPNDITSMLDTMIWFHGQPAGVLCLEHTRTPRRWQEEEIDFAITITDLISLAFETDERVRAEKDELESRLYLEKIVNSIGDPIFVKDGNHKFVLVNAPFCNLVNKNNYEIVGKCDLDFFPPEQASIFEKIDDLVFETGEANINEELITDASGALRNVITKKTLYMGNKGNRYIVGVIRDITDQKRIDEERSKMAKLESIGMLAGGIAHDFNNILMGILGNLTLAKTRCANDKIAHEVLVRAESVVHRARSLTEQLITFSKGGLPIKKRCAINDLVKNTVQFTLSGSKMKPSFDLDPGSKMVEIDEGQFAQVIANIVINSRQANEDGGELSVSVRNFETITRNEFPHSSGKYVKLCISDDGPGIAEENLTKIFDPYFTTKPSGTGLGLFTSYSIVSKHNGFIRAVSSRGAGAAFEIYLPVFEIVDEPPEPKEFLPAGAESSAAGLYNILVMDDEPDTLAPVCDMLSERGNAVTLAENGDEAFAAYMKKLKSGGRFDVVIADILVKKGMGGVEFTGKLLEADPCAVVIASSGGAGDEMLIDYARYGFKNAIAKPYKAEELFEMIERTVSGAKK